jgi:hypothetical protein
MEAYSWENHRKSWENTIEIEVFGWEIEVNGGFQWKILNGVLMVRLYITGMIKRMFSWDLMGLNDDDLRILDKP